MERKNGGNEDGIAIFEDQGASAIDVDWTQLEIPVAFPSNGLSEGASLVRLKNGKIGVLQRSVTGSHYGVKVFTDDIRKVLKSFFNKS